MIPRPLSRRQSEVFAALILGKKLPEIAEQVRLHPGTVKYHIGQVLQRTEAHTQQELVQRHIQELRAALVELRCFMQMAVDRDVLNAEEVAPLIQCADDALDGKRAVQS